MIGKAASAAKDRLLTMAPLERLSSGKNACVKGAGTIGGDRHLLPVLDVHAALSPRDVVASDRFAGGRIGAHGRDACTEGSHPSELDGIHILRDEHLHGHATAPAGIGHHLPEIARR